MFLGACPAIDFNRKQIMAEADRSARYLFTKSDGLNSISVNESIRSTSSYRTPVFKIDPVNISISGSEARKAKYARLIDCELSNNFYNVTLNNNRIQWLRKVRLSLNNQAVLSITDPAIINPYNNSTILDNDWHLCTLYIKPGVYESSDSIIAEVDRVMNSSINSLFHMNTVTQPYYMGISLKSDDIYNPQGTIYLKNASIDSPVFANSTSRYSAYDFYDNPTYIVDGGFVCSVGGVNTNYSDCMVQLSYIDASISSSLITNPSFIDRSINITNDPVTRVQKLISNSNLFVNNPANNENMLRTGYIASCIGDVIIMERNASPIIKSNVSIKNLSFKSFVDHIGLSNNSNRQSFNNDTYVYKHDLNPGMYVDLILQTNTVDDSYMEVTSGCIHIFNNNYTSANKLVSSLIDYTGEILYNDYVPKLLVYYDDQSINDSTYPFYNISAVRRSYPTIISNNYIRVSLDSNTNIYGGYKTNPVTTIETYEITDGVFDDKSLVMTGYSYDRLLNNGNEQDIEMNSDVLILKDSATFTLEEHTPVSYSDHIKTLQQLVVFSKAFVTIGSPTNTILMANAKTVLDKYVAIYNIDLSIANLTEGTYSYTRQLDGTYEDDNNTTHYYKILYDGHEIAVDKISIRVSTTTIIISVVVQTSTLIECDAEGYVDMLYYWDTASNSLKSISNNPSATNRRYAENALTKNYYSFSLSSNHDALIVGNSSANNAFKSLSYDSNLEVSKLTSESFSLDNVYTTSIENMIAIPYGTHEKIGTVKLDNTVIDNTKLFTDVIDSNIVLTLSKNKFMKALNKNTVNNTVVEYNVVYKYIPTCNEYYVKANNGSYVLIEHAMIKHNGTRIDCTIDNSVTGVNSNKCSYSTMFDKLIRYAISNNTYSKTNLSDTNAHYLLYGDVYVYFDSTSRYDQVDTYIYNSNGKYLEYDVSSSDIVLTGNSNTIYYPSTIPNTPGKLYIEYDRGTKYRQYIEFNKNGTGPQYVYINDTISPQALTVKTNFIPIVNSVNVRRITSTNSVGVNSNTLFKIKHTSTDKTYASAYYEVIANGTMIFINNESIELKIFPDTLFTRSIPYASFYMEKCTNAYSYNAALIKLKPIYDLYDDNIYNTDVTGKTLVDSDGFIILPSNGEAIELSWSNGVLTYDSIPVMPYESVVSGNAHEYTVVSISTSVSIQPVNNVYYLREFPYVNVNTNPISYTVDNEAVIVLDTAMQVYKLPIDQHDSNVYMLTLQPNGTYLYGTTAFYIKNKLTETFYSNSSLTLTRVQSNTNIVTSKKYTHCYKYKADNTKNYIKTIGGNYYTVDTTNEYASSFANDNTQTESVWLCLSNNLSDFASNIRYYEGVYEVGSTRYDVKYLGYDDTANKISDVLSKLIIKVTNSGNTNEFIFAKLEPRHMFKNIDTFEVNSDGTSNIKFGVIDANRMFTLNSTTTFTKNYCSATNMLAYDTNGVYSYVTREDENIILNKVSVSKYEYANQNVRYELVPENSPSQGDHININGYIHIRTPMTIYNNNFVATTYTTILDYLQNMSANTKPFYIKVGETFVEIPANPMIYGELAKPDTLYYKHDNVRTEITASTYGTNNMYDFYTADDDDAKCKYVVLKLEIRFGSTLTPPKDPNTSFIIQCKNTNVRLFGTDNVGTATIGNALLNQPSDEWILFDCECAGDKYYLLYPTAIDSVHTFSVDDDNTVSYTTTQPMPSNNATISALINNEFIQITRLNPLEEWTDKFYCNLERILIGTYDDMYTDIDAYNSFLPAFIRIQDAYIKPLENQIVYETAPESTASESSLTLSCPTISSFVKTTTGYLPISNAYLYSTSTVIESAPNLSSTNSGIPYIECIGSTVSYIPAYEYKEYALNSTAVDANGYTTESYGTITVGGKKHKFPLQNIFCPGVTPNSYFPVVQESGNRVLYQHQPKLTHCFINSTVTSGKVVLASSEFKYNSEGDTISYNKFAGLSCASYTTGQFEIYNPANATFTDTHVAFDLIDGNCTLGINVPYDKVICDGITAVTFKNNNTDEFKISYSTNFSSGVTGQMPRLTYGSLTDDVIPNMYRNKIIKKTVSGGNTYYVILGNTANQRIACGQFQHTSATVPDAMKCDWIFRFKPIRLYSCDKNSSYQSSSLLTSLQATVGSTLAYYSTSEGQVLIYKYIASSSSYETTPTVFSNLSTSGATMTLTYSSGHFTVSGDDSYYKICHVNGNTISSTSNITIIAAYLISFTAGDATCNCVTIELDNTGVTKTGVFDLTQYCGSTIVLNRPLGEGSFSYTISNITQMDLKAIDTYVTDADITVGGNVAMTRCRLITYNTNIKIGDLYQPKVKHSNASISIHDILTPLSQGWYKYNEVWLNITTPTDVTPCDACGDTTMLWYIDSNNDNAGGEVGGSNIVYAPKDKVTPCYADDKGCVYKEVQSPTTLFGIPCKESFYCGNTLVVLKDMATNATVDPRLYDASTTLTNIINLRLSSAQTGKYSIISPRPIEVEIYDMDGTKHTGSTFQTASSVIVIGSTDTINASCNGSSWILTCNNMQRLAGTYIIKYNGVELKSCHYSGYSNKSFVRVYDPSGAKLLNDTITVTRGQTKLMVAGSELTKITIGTQLFGMKQLKNTNTGNYRSPILSCNVDTRYALSYGTGASKDTTIDYACTKNMRYIQAFTDTTGAYKYYAESDPNLPRYVRQFIEPGYNIPLTDVFQILSHGDTTYAYPLTTIANLVTANMSTADTTKTMYVYANDQIYTDQSRTLIGTITNCFAWGNHIVDFNSTFHTSDNNVTLTYHINDNTFTRDPDTTRYSLSYHNTGSALSGLQDGDQIELNKAYTGIARLRFRLEILLDNMQSLTLKSNSIDQYIIANGDYADEIVTVTNLDGTAYSFTRISATDTVQLIYSTKLRCWTYESAHLLISLATSKYIIPSETKSYALSYSEDGYRITIDNTEYAVIPCSLTAPYTNIPEFNLTTDNKVFGTASSNEFSMYCSIPISSKYVSSTDYVMSNSMMKSLMRQSTDTLFDLYYANQSSRTYNLTNNTLGASILPAIALSQYVPTLSVRYWKNSNVLSNFATANVYRINEFGELHEGTIDKTTTPNVLYFRNEFVSADSQAVETLSNSNIECYYKINDKVLCTKNGSKFVTGLDKRLVDVKLNGAALANTKCVQCDRTTLFLTDNQMNVMRSLYVCGTTQRYDRQIVTYAIEKHVPVEYVMSSTNTPSMITTTYNIEYNAGTVDSIAYIDKFTSYFYNNRPVKLHCDNNIINELNNMYTSIYLLYASGSWQIYWKNPYSDTGASDVLITISAIQYLDGAKEMVLATDVASNITLISNGRVKYVYINVNNTYTKSSTKLFTQDDTVQRDIYYRSVSKYVNTSNVEAYVYQYTASADDTNLSWQLHAFSHTASTSGLWILNQSGQYIQLDSTKIFKRDNVYHEYSDLTDTSQSFIYVSDDASYTLNGSNSYYPSEIYIKNTILKKIDVYTEIADKYFATLSITGTSSATGYAYDIVMNVLLSGNNLISSLFITNTAQMVIADYIHFPLFAVSVKGKYFFRSDVLPKYVEMISSTDNNVKCTLLEYINENDYSDYVYNNKRVIDVLSKCNLYDTTVLTNEGSVKCITIDEQINTTSNSTTAESMVIDNTLNIVDIFFDAQSKLIQHNIDQLKLCETYDASSSSAVCVFDYNKIIKSANTDPYNIKSGTYNFSNSGAQHYTYTPMDGDFENFTVKNVEYIDRALMDTNYKHSSYTVDGAGYIKSNDTTYKYFSSLLNSLEYDPRSMTAMNAMIEKALYCSKLTNSASDYLRIMPTCNRSYDASIFSKPTFDECIMDEETLPCNFYLFGRLTYDSNLQTYTYDNSDINTRISTSRNITFLDSTGSPITVSSANVMRATITDIVNSVSVVLYVKHNNIYYKLKRDMQGTMLSEEDANTYYKVWIYVVNVCAKASHLITEELNGIDRNMYSDTNDTSDTFYYPYCEPIYANTGTAISNDVYGNIYRTSYVMKTANLISEQFRQPVLSNSQFCRLDVTCISPLIPNSSINVNYKIENNSVVTCQFDTTTSVSLTNQLVWMINIVPIESQKLATYPIESKNRFADAGLLSQSDSGAYTSIDNKTVDIYNVDNGYCIFKYPHLLSASERHDACGNTLGSVLLYEGVYNKNRYDYISTPAYSNATYVKYDTETISLVDGDLYTALYNPISLSPYYITLNTYVTEYNAYQNMFASLDDYKKRYIHSFKPSDGISLTNANDAYGILVPEYVVKNVFAQNDIAKLKCYIRDASQKFASIDDLHKTSERKQNVHDITINITKKAALGNNAKLVELTNLTSDTYDLYEVQSDTSVCQKADIYATETESTLTCETYHMIRFTGSTNGEIINTNANYNGIFGLAGSVLSNVNRMLYNTEYELTYNHVGICARVTITGLYNYDFRHAIIGYTTPTAFNSSYTGTCKRISNGTDVTIQCSIAGLPSVGESISNIIDVSGLTAGDISENETTLNIELWNCYSNTTNGITSVVLSKTRASQCKVSYRWQHKHQDKIVTLTNQLAMNADVPKLPGCDLLLYGTQLTCKHIHPYILLNNERVYIHNMTIANKNKIRLIACAAYNTGMTLSGNRVAYKVKFGNNTGNISYTHRNITYNLGAYVDGYLDKNEFLNAWSHVRYGSFGPMPTALQSTLTYEIEFGYECIASDYGYHIISNEVVDTTLTQSTLTNVFNKRTAYYTNTDVQSDAYSPVSEKSYIENSLKSTTVADNVTYTVNAVPTTTDLTEQYWYMKHDGTIQTYDYGKYYFIPFSACAVGSGNYKTDGSTVIFLDYDNHLTKREYTNSNGVMIQDSNGATNISINAYTLSFNFLNTTTSVSLSEIFFIPSNITTYASGFHFYDEVLFSNSSGIKYDATQRFNDIGYSNVYTIVHNNAEYDVLLYDSFDNPITEDVTTLSADQGNFHSYKFKLYSGTSNTVFLGISRVVSKGINWQVSTPNTGYAANTKCKFEYTYTIFTYNYDASESLASGRFVKLINAHLSDVQVKDQAFDAVQTIGTTYYFDPTNVICYRNNGEYNITDGLYTHEYVQKSDGEIYIFDSGFYYDEHLYNLQIIHNGTSDISSVNNVKLVYDSTNKCYTHNSITYKVFDSKWRELTHDALIVIYVGNNKHTCAYGDIYISYHVPIPYNLKITIEGGNTNNITVGSNTYKCILYDDSFAVAHISAPNNVAEGVYRNTVYGKISECEVTVKMNSSSYMLPKSANVGITFSTNIGATFRSLSKNIVPYYATKTSQTGSYAERHCFDGLFAKIDKPTMNSITMSRSHILLIYKFRHIDQFYDNSLVNKKLVNTNNSSTTIMRYHRKISNCILLNSINDGVTTHHITNNIMPSIEPVKSSFVTRDYQIRNLAIGSMDEIQGINNKRICSPVRLYSNGQSVGICLHRTNFANYTDYCVKLVINNKNEGYLSENIANIDYSKLRMCGVDSYTYDSTGNYYDNVTMYNSPFGFREFNYDTYGSLLTGNAFQYCLIRNKYDHTTNILTFNYSLSKNSIRLDNIMFGEDPYTNKINTITKPRCNSDMFPSNIEFIYDAASRGTVVVPVAGDTLLLKQNDVYVYNGKQVYVTDMNGVEINSLKDTELLTIVSNKFYINYQLNTEIFIEDDTSTEHILADGDHTLYYNSMANAYFLDSDFTIQIGVYNRFNGMKGSAFTDVTGVDLQVSVNNGIPTVQNAILKEVLIKLVGGNALFNKAFRIAASPNKSYEIPNLYGINLFDDTSDTQNAWQCTFVYNDKRFRLVTKNSSFPIIYSYMLNKSIDSGTVIDGYVNTYGQDINALLDTSNATKENVTSYIATDSKDLLYDDYYANIINKNSTQQPLFNNNESTIEVFDEILPVYAIDDMPSTPSNSQQNGTNETIMMPNIVINNNGRNELTNDNNKLIRYNSIRVDNFYKSFRHNSDLWQKLGVEPYEIKRSGLMNSNVGIDNVPYNDTTDVYYINGNSYTEELFSGPIISRRDFSLTGSNGLSISISIGDDIRTHLDNINVNKLILSRFVTKSFLPKLDHSRSIIIKSTQNADIEKLLNMNLHENGRSIGLLHEHELDRNEVAKYNKLIIDINKTISIPDNGSVYVYMIGSEDAYMMQSANVTLNVEYIG